MTYIAERILHQKRPGTTTSQSTIWRSLCLCALLTASFPLLAQRQSIDFETNNAQNTGTVLPGFTRFGPGTGAAQQPLSNLGITITATRNGVGIDSFLLPSNSASGGDDEILGSPNEDCVGGGNGVGGGGDPGSVGSNCSRLHNVLTIPVATGSTNATNNPGVFTISFNQSVTLNSLTTLGGTAATVTFFAGPNATGGQVGGTVAIADNGDNAYLHTTINRAAIQSLTVAKGGDEFAITEFAYTPTGASPNIFVCPAGTTPAVLDWDNVFWLNGSTSNSFAVGANLLTFTATSAAGFVDFEGGGVDTPADIEVFSSIGSLGNGQQLVFHTPATSDFSLEIALASPAVVLFSLHDIDGTERFSIAGVSGGSDVPVLGEPVNGNFLNTTNGLTSLIAPEFNIDATDSFQNSATGLTDSNGTASFISQSAISTMTLDGADVLDDYKMSISDITICNVSAANPSIELQKVGTLNDDDGTPGVSEGDTISYAFTVNNNGNVPLTNITLADTVGGVTIMGGPIALLAAGASDNTTFTGSYTLTQNDIDSNSFTNTATVTGTAPDTSQAMDSDDDTQNFPDPVLVAVKSVEDASADGIAQAGESLTYSIIISNSGGAVANDVSVTDLVNDAGITVNTAQALVITNALDVAPASPDISDLQNGITLDIASGTTATISYTVTVTDPIVDNDVSIENLVTVTDDGDPVCDNAGSDCDTTIPTDPNITVIKSLSNGGPIAEAGEDLTYTITFSNTGGSAITYAAGEIVETVPANTTAAGGDDFDCADGDTGNCGNTAALVVPASDGTTAGTASLTFIVTVDSPIPAGVTSIDNAVVVPNECNDPDDDAGNECDESTPTAPQLLATKNVVDASGDSIAQAGEALTYTISIANSGGSLANNVNVMDPVNDSGITVDPGQLLVIAGASDVTPANPTIADLQTGITLDIAAGDTGTVSYTVTVTD